jgi:multiple sugar transport system permease protein
VDRIAEIRQVAQGSGAAPPAGARRLRSAQREVIAFYLSIGPWLLGFLLFILGPMLVSLFISFTEWDLLSTPEWIGLDNYARMLDDRRFWQALRVTTLYTLIYVPADLVGGLLLALLVQPRLRGVRVFRTIFYLPTVLSGVAFVVVWLWMLNPSAGLVNTLLAQLGIQGPRWLLDPQWALASLLLMSFWGWGRTMVIFLAGLQAIPEEFYEAAAMDGAGALRRFSAITLPLLTPAIFFNLVLGIINTFQTFTSAFVATDGGPLDATLFFVLYLYKQAFEFRHMGYAAALAWVLFALVLALTLVIFRSQRLWVFYGGERDA